ncbi:hypothetical protein LTR36_003418 [Oleoguttula mirabilis]|uniref:CENP-V/GFA domain-containing protein n=1 Tax=Oleoguttula mirabilis TaxID=1507867 RepID=A0AAV9JJA2_9PEZI|nr:hypothetical protein LTR36_003418 [Oleoguttula mirabilis]
MATSTTATSPESSPHTLTVSCHCNALRLSVPRLPEYLNLCQCSICRNYGASWAYYDTHEITVLSPTPAASQDQRSAGLDAEGTRKYVWGDKNLAFTFCETCGCIVYWWPLDGSDGVGVNMNCVEDVEALRFVERRVTYDVAKVVLEGVYNENGPLRS